MRYGVSTKLNLRTTGSTVNAETEGVRLEGILLLHDHVSQRIPQSMVLCLKLE